MVPDCRRLPEWVRWIAQDADGVWWAYEHEPNRSDAGWYENEVGRSLRIRRDAPNPQWRREIHAVNKM